MRKKLKEVWRIPVGLLLLAYGIFALYTLTQGNVGWYVSNFLLEFILIVVGVAFLRFTIINFKKLPKVESTINLIVSLFLLFFGLWPLGVDFELLTFLPFAMEISVNPILLAVIILAFGAYLVVDEAAALFGK